jgi:hypothetical protein
MNNDLIMKAITLSGEEKKVINGSTVISIKDEKGLKYSFWEKKQDGSVSKAYEGYQKFSLGDTVEIHYSEAQKTNKEGKAYTARSIAFFGEKVQPSAPIESRSSEANKGQSGASGRDFDKEAVGKCQSLFLAAYLQAGNKFSDALLQVGQAKKLAEMVVYGKTEKVAPDIQEAAEQMSEDLPVIQQDNELDSLAESVPF